MKHGKVAPIFKSDHMGHSDPKVYNGLSAEELGCLQSGQYYQEEMDMESESMDDEMWNLLDTLDEILGDDEASIFKCVQKDMLGYRDVHEATEWYREDFLDVMDNLQRAWDRVRDRNTFGTLFHTRDEHGNIWLHLGYGVAKWGHESGLPEIEWQREKVLASRAIRVPGGLAIRWNLREVASLCNRLLGTNLQTLVTRRWIAIYDKAAG